MADGHWVNCHRCQTQYFLPLALHISAKANEGITFCCPYGHSAHYPAGPTTEDKLRQERDRLAQRIAQRDDEISRQRDRVAATERQLYAAKGRITKIKNRVGHGVCPCCTRSFSNLAKHMASQHSDFAKSGDGDAATVN